MKFCSPACAANAAATRYFEIHGGLAYRQNTGGYLSSKSRLLHRVIWRDANGEIPVGFAIHHKDGNKLNNDLNNLELLEWGEHTRLHNSTGIPLGKVTCLFCKKSVQRRMSEIRRGQDKYCSRKCANSNRRRDEGKYA